LDCGVKTGAQVQRSRRAIAIAFGETFGGRPSPVARRPQGMHSQGMHSQGMHSMNC